MPSQILELVSSNFMLDYGLFAMAGTAIVLSVLEMRVS